MSRAFYFILLGMAAVPFAALAHGQRPAALPLGDGRISASALRGHVFSCQTQFAGGGAFRDGSWIQGRWWYPDGKVKVGGEVPWPQARLTRQTVEDKRVLIGNGLPINQKTGIFPVRPEDEAYAYDRNPNAILPQAFTLELPLAPQLLKKPACVPAGMVGVTLSGVALFSALDDMGRDAPAHELQDKCGGHPEKRGQYHYHGWSECIPDNAKEGAHSALVGYALDGFGIFGVRGEGGKVLTNNDLDACHGHIHSIVWDEGKEVVMYHYHFTHEYPYSLGCFRARPVALPREMQPLAPGGAAKRQPFAVQERYPPPPSDFVLPLLR